MAPSVGSAASALVFEPYNGIVLYAEDPDAQWFPASLTKLMAAASSAGKRDNCLDPRLTASMPRLHGP